MAKLYKYYQVEGGEEAWTVIQANASLDVIRPAFVTVLSLDTIIPEAPDKELLDSVKYLGPMYFDLDAEDVDYSINGAKLLILKLAELGLQPTDMEIYLSGKRGVHILIPPEVFMERVQPTARLPAIYKEIAFKLGTETVDYKVYTGRRGRMLRTCYRVRDNARYRVPITFAELGELDAAGYDVLTSAPRSVDPATPNFRPKFALVYDECAQKVSKVKRTRKQINPAQLKKDMPTIQKVLDGDVVPGIGFNKIAIQVALYAREVGWSEKDLVEKAERLLLTHESDGTRYNTPGKRAQELQRMLSYVDDNPAYDYDLSGIKSLLPRTSEQIPTEDSDARPEGYSEVFLQGVEARHNCYVVVTEKGELPISNFVLDVCEKLVSVTDEVLVCLKVKMRGRNVKLTIFPNTCTSSSSLHNTVAAFGGSFTGSDTQARAIWQIMLRESKSGHYLVDSEGVNLVSFPHHYDKGIADRKWLIWADRTGVILPPELQGRVEVMFQGFPEEAGRFQTDLAMAPSMADFMKFESNRNNMLRCISAYLECNTDETLAKALGWMVAANWRPVFQDCYGRFPLLHVFGPAGLGKTDNIIALLQMFYYKQEVFTTSPSSTYFGLVEAIAGSSSIPVFCDEWKPHTMQKDKAEQFRALFRDTFNARTTMRGGGNRSSQHFAAMLKLSLTAPLIYASEAPETETALVERSIMLSFRRVGGLQMAYSLQKFLEFQSLAGSCLPALGKWLAGQALTEDLEVFRSNFDKQFQWASSRYLISDADTARYEAGEMSEEEYSLKVAMKPRMLYNSTVVLFGLGRLRAFLQEYYPEEFKAKFEARFRQLGEAAYLNSASLLQAAVPEYQKVLTVMGQMTSIKVPGGNNYLNEGDDYNIFDIAGKPVLALASANAYAAYRQFSRLTGSTAFYPDAIAFDSALGETPFFLKRGSGTLRNKVPTIVLDYEKYLRHGGVKWQGSARPYPI